MIAPLLRVGAADLVLLLAGYAAVGTPARRVRLPLVPLAALAFLTGCGILAVLTTVLGVLGGPTAAWPVTGPVLGALAAAGLALAIRDRVPRPGRPDVTWLGYAASLVVAARFALTAGRAPVLSNDEYMMWGMRGRVLAAGHLDPLVFGGSAQVPMYQSREYPLGVPALYSWVSGWVGPRLAEFGAHAQVPLLGCAGLLIAVWAVREHAASVPAAVAAVLIGPAFFALRWAGSYTATLLFADLPEAAAALAAVLLVLRWLTDRRPAWLALAAGPAVAALYFKEEGLVFVAAPCLAAALVTLAGRRRAGWWSPLLLLATAYAARLPWQLWLAAQGIPNRFLRRPVPQYGAADAVRLTGRVGADLARYWPIPHVFWLLPAALVLAAVTAALTPVVRRPAAYLAGTLALVVAGIWLQYVITALATRNGYGYIGPYMSFNAPRVLMLPTVLAWFTALLTASTALRTSDDTHLGSEVAGSGVTVPVQ